ncbi:hypothetical protein AQ490_15820 [Wenjunlia vitaminophila]|uniref:DUF3040 domain-containing protein n=1 Tax=Wenjunlia vitaminophila TaxID=76728 RepID=A0A0T6LWQ5_WENVI|nr:DUF3040 domain-containing protein [Wenjunlia vitaminophila]KRV50539.1 hypothetical protein AQ490_15820 [Wenjunlia vitaminophila]
MELTPRERRALDGIAADLGADRRLRRSLRGFHPPLSRRRVVATLAVLCALTAAGPCIAVLGVGPQSVAVLALAVVFGAVGLLLWIARGG